MADIRETARNAARIGKYALDDLIIKPVQKAMDYSRYAYGLNPEYSLANDVARIGVGQWSDRLRGVADWVNSTPRPSVPVPVPGAPNPARQALAVQEPVSQVDTPAAAALGNPIAGTAADPTRSGGETRISFQGGGGFTGPNNDPNTPGMTREWVTEPMLEAFDPGDSRFAKRQLEIAQQDKRLAKEEQKRVAAQIAEDRAREIANETIDRQRAQAEHDRRMAWMADEQKRAQEAHEARQAWTAANQGLAATPENQKAVFEAQQRNHSIEEFRGAWTDLAQKESQVPIIFEAIKAGEDISQAAPDIAAFIKQWAPDLDNLPPDQKSQILDSIQQDLMAQIKTQKFTAQKALEQRNKQNFGRQNVVDELTGITGQ